MPGVLYRKERQVLEFLAQFQKQYGYSPTLSEIAQATGHRSNSTVHTLIRSLVEKGYVQKVDGNTRVLKILDEKMTSGLLGTQPSIELPLMGYIAAGSPLEPHTDPNATFQISASMISGKKTAYVLQVKGQSMIEDGIYDGDFVVIEKSEIAENGDIVVALVDDNMATLKKFYKEGGQVVLRPANASMDPIYPKSLKIQGIAVGIVRKFKNYY
ncbi:MAG: repressor LexA [Candidatus Levybacteria bacterium RIFOXYA1_FULL_41_10]|nr:MAG: LexA repressor [Candidatus Levybacteria bacterium GW2011_GWA1_39_34]KKR50842.1 MAG: LexA repressor [Candidatus Levybacteria bacterium GW2011_GWC1_40_19]KKR72049.1 MAG: LexA repressor [Candidatus Levybacteria bacterium GW2011_GWC2_40_7]KKR95255.1 MAG: LexA repressor [Candidatus Levybacteria bacterium GW2011_GWA2_41_15]KKS01789.1 MAG: LexA repressor [Candidatus Levybacteria bacterium GW2011_GWB1_41_21]OGH20372.1 MAG: repressor LexA [Candidatus Levybacteria bacterium RIFCSPHIGHO2_01_FULL_